MRRSQIGVRAIRGMRNTEMRIMGITGTLQIKLVSIKNHSKMLLMLSARRIFLKISEGCSHFKMFKISSYAADNVNIGLNIKHIGPIKYLGILSHKITRNEDSFADKITNEVASTNKAS